MVENNKIKKTENNFRDFFLRPYIRARQKTHRYIDTDIIIFMVIFKYYVI